MEALQLRDHHEDLLEHQVRGTWPVAQAHHREREGEPTTSAVVLHRCGHHLQVGSDVPDGGYERLFLNLNQNVYMIIHWINVLFTEIVRAMTHVIQQGWAMYWGTSRWTQVEVHYHTIITNSKHVSMTSIPAVLDYGIVHQLSTVQLRDANRRAVGVSHVLSREVRAVPAGDVQQDRRRPDGLGTAVYGTGRHAERRTAAVPQGLVQDEEPQLLVDGG